MHIYIYTYAYIHITFQDLNKHMHVAHTWATWIRSTHTLLVNLPRQTIVTILDESEVSYKAHSTKPMLIVRALEATVSKHTATPDPTPHSTPNHAPYTHISATHTHQLPHTPTQPPHSHSPHTRIVQFIYIHLHIGTGL